MVDTVARRGTAVTVVLVVLAFVSGDAAMAAVATMTLFITHLVWLRWVIATPIIALGAYFIFGYTQIRAWNKGAAKDIPETDRRTQWGVDHLSKGGMAAYVLVSFITGPLGIGWFYGRKHDPRAYALTWWSAWILAVPWSAFYVGLASLIYHFFF